MKPLYGQLVKICPFIFIYFYLFIFFPQVISTRSLGRFDQPLLSSVDSFQFGSKFTPSMFIESLHESMPLNSFSLFVSFPSSASFASPSTRLCSARSPRHRKRAHITSIKTIRADKMEIWSITENMV